jgi:hypothetical protein
MRRLWLKFELWCAGYCTVHLRPKKFVVFGPGGGATVCPQCREDDYERWQHRLRLMREEYQELDARR